jgi:phage terminase Nu1 subunit (DNA packaging protein)
MEQQIIRKKELATLLRVSPRTVENFAQRGMPCIRPSSRLVLFDKAACLKWITDSYSIAAKPSSYRPRVTAVSSR